MDFNFSDDQEQLRDAASKWVTKGYPFERRRAIASAGGFSREAYAELAELGLCALSIPEAHGGLDMGPIESMVVMEELGRGLVLAFTGLKPSWTSEMDTRAGSSSTLRTVPVVGL